MAFSDAAEPHAKRFAPFVELVEHFLCISTNACSVICPAVCIRMTLPTPDLDISCLSALASLGRGGGSCGLAGQIRFVRYRGQSITDVRLHVAGRQLPFVPSIIPIVL